LDIKKNYHFVKCDIVQQKKLFRANEFVIYFAYYLIYSESQSFDQLSDTDSSSGAAPATGGMNPLGARQGSFESWKEGEALLEHMSFPPTDDELAHLPTLTPSQLPPKYTRSNAGRVFVNRSLRLDRITWVGCTTSFSSRALRSA
jgi:hypothetical protein